MPTPVTGNCTIKPIIMLCMKAEDLHNKCANIHGSININSQLFTLIKIGERISREVEFEHIATDKFIAGKIEYEQ